MVDKEALIRLEKNVELMQEREIKQNELINKLTENVSSLAESCKRLHHVVIGDEILQSKGIYHDVLEHKEIVSSFKTIKWFMVSVVCGVFGIVGAIMYAVFAIMDHLHI